MGETRVDLTLITKHLNRILKDKAHQYFDILRRFWLGKIPKNEFDTTCKNLLGRHIIFHNWFVLAILNNAHAPDPVTIKRQVGDQVSSEAYSFDESRFLDPSSKKKRKGSLLDAPKGKRRKTEDDEMDSEPGNRSYQTLLQSCPKFSSLLVPPPSLSRSQYTKKLSILSTIKRVPSAAPSRIERPPDLEAKLLPPTHLVLRRMIRVTQDNGVLDVSREAVLLVAHALSYHLKGLKLNIADVLSSCAPYVRKQQIPELMNQQQVHEGRSDVIYPQDVLVTALLKPLTFGDNLSLILSRLKYGL